MGSSFNSHKLQPGKKANNTILKHRYLRKIANLLRYVEFCVVLVLVSRLSIQLPVAVKNSSEYFQGFSVFMASPPFVFLLGNAIIIALVAQSGHFSARDSATDNPESDLYQEFLQNSIVSYKNQGVEAEKTEHPRKQSIRKTEDTVIKQILQNVDCDRVNYPERLSLSVRTENSIKGRRIDGSIVKYRVKQSMKAATKTEDRVKDPKIDGVKLTNTNINSEAKDYKRCQSEIVRHAKREEPQKVLQRSESEKNRGSIEPAKNSSSYPEDGMSNDEFRRTIEAFIARQQRLRKQEQCFAA